MRKRLVILAVAGVVVLAACGPLGSGGSSGSGGVAAAQQQRLFAWMFGSSTNPLLTDNFCGQVVGSEFMLTAGNAPDLQRSCDVPFGLPILASPGGCFDWFPVGQLTDAEITAARDTDCPLSSYTDVTARLDGHPLDVTHGFASTKAYTIPAQPGSLVKTIDDSLPAGATQARAASMGWTLSIPPLLPGRHTLALSDTIDGDKLSITFILTVRLPGEGH